MAGKKGQKKRVWSDEESKHTAGLAVTHKWCGVLIHLPVGLGRLRHVSTASRNSLM
jgi:hypothetical protein